MAFDPVLSAVRFGTGRSPSIADPASPEAMLAALAGEDRMAKAHPIPAFHSIFPETREVARIEKARRDGTASGADLKRRVALRRELQARRLDLMARTFARGLDCEDGLRERLTWFWADHFTVISRRTVTGGGVSMFVEDAIRPHVAGRFADMLRAAVLHPMMLLYLDQSDSVGPNSRFARDNPARGLNENLAREVMELHTLGVAGAYGQRDVRQLAEVFAGVRGVPQKPTQFYSRRGEPGPKKVLGHRYGTRDPRLEDVLDVLDDLAAHPDTARHIGRKLAVHFVSDNPEPDLVRALAQAFRRSGGDLMAVTGVLLDHPAAQARPLTKAKPPFDFMVSGLRALGVAGREVAGRERGALRRDFLTPMARMGQPWQLPEGPDGWPEAASDWITPQGMAARISWAMDLGRVIGRDLPDPRQFVRTALGGLATDRAVFAARAAETRSDGVAVVLASPEFQRR